jgi:hypothetical protein
MESHVDARVRGCVALALIVASARPVAASDPGSEALPATVATSLLEARADESLDEALLLELDELLRDPVDLARDDVSRLRVLPWLGTEQLDALRAAKAPASAAELAALPSWNVEEAQRTRAFVRFAPPSAPRSRTHGSLRTAFLRTRRDVLVEASQQPLRIVARWNSLRREAVGYAAALETPAARLVAGDLRVRHAQGLLWWSGEDRLRAAGAAIRSASGVVPNRSLDRERVVRGAALEAGGVVRARLVLGDGTHGRVAAGTFGTQAPRLGLFEGGIVYTRERSWFGAAWSARTQRARLAMEVVASSGRAAMLAGAAWRVRQIAVRARLEHATAGSLSPWSAAAPARRRSRSRQGLLRVGLRRRRTHVELAAAHGMRRDSLGTRLRRSEHSASVTWSQQPVALELRLRQRIRHERAVWLESFADAADSRTRSVVIRMRRVLRSSTWVGLEYRAVETHTLSGARTDTGSAWLLQLEHRAAGVSARWILSSFSAPSGRAALYVPEPYVAGTFSSVRVHGEGIRVASGVSIGEQRVRLRARAASVLTVEGGSDLDVEMSLSLRFR